MSLEPKPICRGYARVSTEKQKKEGVSIETQQKAIQAFCGYRNLDLIEPIYTDEAYSGKNTDRPAFQKLLKDIQPGEYLVVYQLSRFSRNTKDALNLLEVIEKEKKAIFVCMDPEIDLSKAFGRMLFSVLMAFYQLERDNFAKLVTVNMTRLSLEGKLRTRPPYGYRFVGKDRDLEENPDQQEVILKICRLFQEGTNIHQITKILNEDVDLIESRSGKIFYGEQVKKVLIDHGLRQPNQSLAKRKPLVEKITSCHREVVGPIWKDRSKLIRLPQLQLILDKCTTLQDICHFIKNQNQNLKSFMGRHPGLDDEDEYNKEIIREREEIIRLAKEKREIVRIEKEKSS